MNAGDLMYICHYYNLEVTNNNIVHNHLQKSVTLQHCKVIGEM